MDIQEVYDKYKHMDKVFSDEQAIEDSFRQQVIYDLWQAIRSEAETKRERTDHADENTLVC